ncbi:MAG TPA: cupin domain-containing protein [Streptosporangiaceae bacterium]|nr:cupin domain-containing protein [Streptosporangiaceae bacterium]
MSPREVTGSEGRTRSAETKELSSGSAPAAGYRPSPRPTFDHPAVIPKSGTTRHIWGDEESGEILDDIYVSSNKIHQLLFEIPIGGQFTHSPSFRTVFGADEVLYVVEGNVVFADPETGEVVRVGTGESLFFRPGTWHHAFNWAGYPARVLEFFAPPPVTGTSGAYAQLRPLLEDRRYRDSSVLANQIPGTPQRRVPRRLVVVRESEYWWQLDGTSGVVLSGIIASTPHLTVARSEVRGHRWSGWLAHGGDSSGYVLSGVLVLRVSGGSDRGWHELTPGDGFFIPEGSQYQVRNGTSRNAVYLAGAAPSYSAEQCSPA